MSQVEQLESTEAGKALREKVEKRLRSAQLSVFVGVRRAF